MQLILVIIAFPWSQDWANGGMGVGKRRSVKEVTWKLEKTINMVTNHYTKGKQPLYKGFNKCVMGKYVIYIVGVLNLYVIRIIPIDYFLSSKLSTFLVILSPWTVCFALNCFESRTGIQKRWWCWKINNDLYIYVYIICDASYSWNSRLYESLYVSVFFAKK